MENCVYDEFVPSEAVITTMHVFKHTYAIHSHFTEKSFVAAMVQHPQRMYSLGVVEYITLFSLLPLCQMDDAVHLVVCSLCTAATAATQCSCINIDWIVLTMQCVLQQNLCA